MSDCLTLLHNSEDGHLERQRMSQGGQGYIYSLINFLRPKERRREEAGIGDDRVCNTHTGSRTR